jgi:hypothetical protein
LSLPFARSMKMPLLRGDRPIRAWLITGAPSPSTKERRVPEQIEREVVQTSYRHDVDRVVAGVGDDPDGEVV